MEFEHLKDHVCYNHFSVITRLNGTKMRKEKDRRTQNEQTITLLELDSATIITNKQLKVIGARKVRAARSRSTITV